MMATDNKPEEQKKKTKLLKRQANFLSKGRFSKSVHSPRWLRAIGAYFVGSWHELREVRWPTRRATWVLTVAVIIFTAFFFGLIMALDFGFEQLFKRIIL